MSGQAQVATILREVHTIQGPLTFLARFVTPTQSVALWDATFSGYPMQGLQIDQLDTEGAILDQTVMLRPWPVVALFRDGAEKLPLPFLAPDYWILPKHPA